MRRAILILLVCLPAALESQRTATAEEMYKRRLALLPLDSGAWRGVAQKVNPHESCGRYLVPRSVPPLSDGVLFVMAGRVPADSGKTDSVATAMLVSRSGVSVSVDAARAMPTATITALAPFRVEIKVPQKSYADAMRCFSRRSAGIE